MNSQAILNADMATIGGWLRQGWSWWLAELRQLVPARLRGTRQGLREVAIYDGEDGFTFFHLDQKNIPLRSDQPRPYGLAVPAELCLIRNITVPAMSRADLRSYAQIEVDRLFPLPSQDILVDAAIVGPPDAQQRMRARVAAIPRARIDPLLAAALAHRLLPTSVGVAEAQDSRQVFFDFAPVLRAEGRLPKTGRGATIWWALVGVAFFCNAAMLVLRDQQSIDQLSQMVDAQAPAVRVAHIMEQRVQRADMIAGRTSARRMQQDALGDLAAATIALPDTAWSQRYTWDGRSIRMSGYKQPRTDVIADLRKSPRFSNVRATTSDISADIPIGQPFDVTADINWRHP